MLKNLLLCFAENYLNHAKLIMVKCEKSVSMETSNQLSFGNEMKNN